MTLYQTLAGLQVPEDLAPRVVAAVRGRYPTLTDGVDSDIAAVLKVVKFWFTETMAQWEAGVAQGPAQQAALDLLAEYAAAGELARDQATADADAIVDDDTP